jgi:sulfatase modifying factor 1
MHSRLAALVLFTALTCAGYALPVHGADAAAVPSAPVPKPAWATAVGDDAAGHWADVVVGGPTQRMRWIAPGTFLMGSPVAEGGRSSDESQHQVTLSTGYWLADSACTQGMWQAVMGYNPSNFTGDDLHPVEQITWDDTQKFLTKVNAKQPHAGFCLPTEAQWEYACRAGSLGTFAGPALDGMGWFNGNSGDQTHPVKQKAANAWGLFDMHGNVQEWCSDRYGEYPTTEVTDPVGAESGMSRIFRGGNWCSDSWRCRSAYRGEGATNSFGDYLGFRLCAPASAP